MIKRICVGDLLIRKIIMPDIHVGLIVMLSDDPGWHRWDYAFDFKNEFPNELTCIVKSIDDITEFPWIQGHPWKSGVVTLIVNGIVCMYPLENIYIVFDVHGSD